MLNGPEKLNPMKARVIIWILSIMATIAVAVVTEFQLVAVGNVGDELAKGL